MLRDVTRSYVSNEAEPVTTLAKRFGMSDAGFAKMCRRLKVPIQPRGYWARRKAAHPTTRTPLPALTGGRVWLTEGIKKASRRAAEKP